MEGSEQTGQLHGEARPGVVAQWPADSEPAAPAPCFWASRRLFGLNCTATRPNGYLGNATWSGHIRSFAPYWMPVCIMESRREGKVAAVAALAPTGTVLGGSQKRPRFPSQLH